MNKYFDVIKFLLSFKSDLESRKDIEQSIVWITKCHGKLVVNGEISFYGISESWKSDKKPKPLTKKEITYLVKRFITKEKTQFSYMIYKKLDKIFKFLAKDFDVFNENDDIVRIGEFGYVEVELFETLCGSREVQDRYIWVSNNSYKYETEKETVKYCLDTRNHDLLDLTLNDDSQVYYTTGENE